MKFAPVTEQEARDAAAEIGPLPPGEYDFEVGSATETNSKNTGLGMFVLELRVFTPSGKFRQVKDYVMTEGQMAWRLRECAHGLGLMLQYEKGELCAADFEGTGGRCLLNIEKDKSGQYGDRNRVKSYLPAKGARPHPPITFKSLSGNTAEVRKREPVPAGSIDDEIPF